MSSTLSVAHNLTALNTQKNLYGTNRNLAGNISRLSSGYKINQGQDGPADLVISELLRSQIGGVNRATRNSTEAMNVLSIAEGALNEMNEILNKMKQLALHAANGTTSIDQIRADQAEIDSGIATINRISNTTRYGDSQLLNGSLGITYNNKVVQGNSLIDARHTRIDQIFQTKDTKIDVGYTGYDSVKQQANMLNQARRAYFEATGDNRNQVVMAGDKRYSTTAAQTFVSGNASGYANQIRANERVYEAGDSYNVFTEYKFNGVEVGKNTDSEGKVYFEYEQTTYADTGGAAGDTLTDEVINVYADEGRTKLVAQAVISRDITNTTNANAVAITLPTANQQIIFTAVDNSGLTGAVRVDTANFSAQSINNINYRVTDADFDSATGTVLRDQSFILTGNIGSGSFNASKGTDIATLANQINNQSGSTGVGAAVILGQNALTQLNLSKEAEFTMEEGTSQFLALVDAAQAIKMTGGEKNVNTGSLGEVYFLVTGATGSAGANVATETGARASITIEMTNAAGDTLASITMQIDDSHLISGGNETYWDAGSCTLAAAEIANAEGVSFDQTTGLMTFTYEGLEVSLTLDTTLEFGEGGTVDSDAFAADAVGANHFSVAEGGIISAWDFTDRNGQDTLLRGFNTDIDGNVYVKYTWDTAVVGSETLVVDIYKDAAMTELVATSGKIEDALADKSAALNGRYEFTAVNGSGLSGSFELDIDDALATAGYAAHAVEPTININTTADTVVKTDRVTKVGLFNVEEKTNMNGIELNGVKIGTQTDTSRNTDASGYLYAATESITRVEAGENVNYYKMVFYRDASLREKVAETDYHLEGATEVEIKALNNSGLTGQVNFAGSIDTSVVMKMRPEIGMRLYTTDYGATQEIRVQNSEGNLLDYYNTADKQWTDAAVGETTHVIGQNARITVNGQQIITNGLTATVANSVITAQFELNAGILSNYFNALGDGTSFGTTIAQIGYGSGTASARSGQMENSNNLFVNAGSNNRQELYNFQGGLTLQLGDQANVQDRTVVSVASMAAANQGVTTFTDDFYGDGNVTTKTLTLEDIQSGQLASLAVDPQKAIAVIEQAIMDVSNARARLGATQGNLLQTNINNLQVAFENITKTESYIRDTDYATETTEFAKNQIMLQAGTSMLAQANMMNQVVLTLLG